MGWHLTCEKYLRETAVHNMVHGSLSTDHKCVHSTFYTICMLLYRTFKSWSSSCPSVEPSIHPLEIIKLNIFFKEPIVEEWSEEETEEVSVSIHREEVSEGMITFQEY